MRKIGLGGVTEARKWLNLLLTLYSHTSQMFHLIVKNWGDYKIYEMELVIGLLWNMCLVHFSSSHFSELKTPECFEFAPHAEMRVLSIGQIFCCCGLCSMPA